MRDRRQAPAVSSGYGDELWKVVGGIGCGSRQTPQTFTIMLLSVAEWFFFKSSEHFLHPAQTLFWRKIGIKIAKQFAPPLILLIHNGITSAEFMKEKHS
jgi:hypothetical protein